MKKKHRRTALLNVKAALLASTVHRVSVSRNAFIAASRPARIAATTDNAQHIYPSIPPSSRSPTSSATLHPSHICSSYTPTPIQTCIHHHDPQSQPETSGPRETYQIHTSLTLLQTAEPPFTTLLSRPNTVSSRHGSKETQAVPSYISR